MANTPSVLDSFIQIVDICFPGWTWQCRIIRDDGLEYPGHWFGTVIDCSTNFGYHATIPCIGIVSPLFSADHSLGRQAANSQGKDFVRRYQFQWDQSSFEYDTGEGAGRLLRQTATQVQSPVTAFEQFLVQPLPEQGG